MSASENYGSVRVSAAAAGPGSTQHPAAAGGGRTDTTAPAGTGTWNGAAPRGYAHSASASAAAAAQNAAAASAPDAEHALLANGARLPMVGLGTYRIEDPGVIATALGGGYRHLDCASMYGNQAVVGAGIADWVAQGRRPELFITGKIWQTEHHPADARASVQRSITELGCEYLDVLLVHWPEAWLPGSEINGEVKPDGSISLEDTWRGLQPLVEEGLVRGLGLANASLAQVEALLALPGAPHKPLVNQVELHPLLAQRKLVGVCLRKGVVCVAHSVLGRKADGGLLEHPTVKQIAEELGKTPAQVLLKYNVQRGVPIIPKASSRARLDENLSGLKGWRLEPKHKAALDAMDEGKRFIDYPWKDWGSPEDGGATKPSAALG